MGKFRPQMEFLILDEASDAIILGLDFLSLVPTTISIVGHTIQITPSNETLERDTARQACTSVLTLKASRKGETEECNMNIENNISHRRNKFLQEDIAKFHRISATTRVIEHHPIKQRH